jgi:hypothetical protein
MKTRHGALSNAENGSQCAKHETVRPFFAPLTALKKELDDELRKKDTEIPLSVHWVYLYEFGMHI